MPKTGRFQWGDVPFRVQQEVIPNAALFRTAGQGMSWPGAGAGGDPSRNDVMYPVTTEEEARRAVQDYVKQDVAFVKIWVDDREGKLKTLPPALYRAIIDEAGKHNMPVAAHTVKLADAKELYKAGLEGATHLPVRGGDVPDDELIAIIKQRVAKSDSTYLVQRARQLRRPGPRGVGRSAAVGDAVSRTGSEAAGRRDQENDAAGRSAGPRGIQSDGRRGEDAHQCRA